MTDSHDNTDPHDNPDDGLDLSPRDPIGGSSRERVERNSWRNRAIVGSICLVLGFLVFQALSSAKVFFYNVDEALEKRTELADQTFRMQGTVIAEPTQNETGAVLFTIAYETSQVQIRHIGAEPSDLFQVGQPVVVEGHWEGNTFQSTQILVKHDENYVEDNPNRVDYDLPESPA